MGNKKRNPKDLKISWEGERTHNNRSSNKKGNPKTKSQRFFKEEEKFRGSELPVNKGTASKKMPKPRANLDESVERQSKIVHIEERHKSNKGKKKRLNSGALTLVILLVIAVLFLLGPMVIRTVTGTITSTEVLKNGTIEDSFNTEAIIIREEKVFNSDIAGTCISAYKEGEKVPRGATVATVINSASKELIDQMKSLNVRISRAKDDDIMNNEGFISEEIKNIDSNIKENIKDFSSIYSQGDLLKYQDTYKNIEILLDQKKDLKNSDNSSSSYQKQLEREREQIENAIKDKMKNIVSDTPGVVSYSIDGFENDYTPINTGNISAAGFKKMVEDINEGKKIDNSYVKVITDINYYLVCSIKSENIQGFGKGDSIDIRINDKNLVISMVVESIKLEGNEAVIVFKADKGVSETTTMRLVNIDIISRKVSGIKVPKKALADINYVEQKGKVAVIKSGYVYYVGARILLMKGDYAIIENLDPGGEIKFLLNDFIIIDPSRINEGQAVN